MVENISLYLVSSFMQIRGGISMKVGIGVYPFHFVRKCDRNEYPLRNNPDGFHDGCERDLCQGGKIIKDAGFDCIEMSNLGDLIIRFSGYKGDDLNSELRRVAEYYNDIGLEIEKVHAQYQVGDRKNFDWKEFRNETLKDVDKAFAMGATKLVVHADVYTCNYGEYDAKEAFSIAYEYLAPVIEKAKKLGIEIAIENLFEEGQSGSDRLRYTSTTEELIEIIDTFKDVGVSCCWDFGHAACAFGEDMILQMEKVGKRISCTHIHDNICMGKGSIHSYNGLKDIHMPIFFGRINWEDNIAALKKTGYEGVYTLEIGGVRFPTFPDALVEDNMRMLCKNIRYMAENF